MRRFDLCTGKHGEKVPSPIRTLQLGVGADLKLTHRQCDIRDFFNSKIVPKCRFSGPEPAEFAENGIEPKRVARFPIFHGQVRTYFSLITIEIFVIFLRKQSIFPPFQSLYTQTDSIRGNLPPE